MKFALSLLAGRRLLGGFPPDAAALDRGRSVKRPFHRLILVALALAAAPLGVCTAAAAPDVWTGNGSDSLWTNPANWNPGIPGDGDDLSFGASSRTTSTIDDDFIVNSITIEAGAPAYTITVKESLTFGAGNAAKRPGPLAEDADSNMMNLSSRLVLLQLERQQTDATSRRASMIMTLSFAFLPPPGNSLLANEESGAGAIMVMNEAGPVGADLGGLVEFHDQSSAGIATIINSRGQTQGQMPASTQFFDESTAGTATLINDSFNATTYFNDHSTLGNATMTSNGGFVVFTGNAAAGAGSIAIGAPATGAGYGTLQFSNLSSAGSATLTINGGGASGEFGSFAYFNDSTTAGSATIITNGGAVAGALGATTAFQYGTPDGGTARAITKAGGTFDVSRLDSAGMGIGSIEGAGTYILGSKNLSVGGNNLSTTVSGVIKDNNGGSLTKVGNGSLTLSGANTYTGGTTVSHGLLLINNPGGSGTGAGPVTVNSDGILGGTGTIVGTVTVKAGGAVSPGNSPGKLSVTGNYIQQSGSVLNIELGGAVAGTEFDQLAVGGSATLSGTLNVSLVNGFTPATGATFQIISSRSTTGNFAAVNSPGLTVRSSVNSAGVLLTVTKGIQGRPVITSPTTASGAPDHPFTYQITATLAPTSFDATGLPAGLSVNKNTGIISGTPTATGSFPVTISATNAMGTGSATLTLTISTATGQPLNISTRLGVLTGDNVLIGGFIVTGTAPKKMILRAIGPSLGDLGVKGALADTVLELHKPDGSVIKNDNWRDTQEAEIIATKVPPTSSLESGIVATLAPGAYTAIVSGKNGGTGIALVEVYDLDTAADSQLANISTRGFIETGDNAMIGGFIIGGDNSTLLVRAIGPSLDVPGKLQDPILELHDDNGAVIATNDDWQATQKAAIEATTIPPTNPKESAILRTLPPGAYTAIVRGVNNTAGVSLVEVYNLP